MKCFLILYFLTELSFETYETQKLKTQMTKRAVAANKDGIEV